MWLQTELINDEDDEEGDEDGANVAISSLHERQLLKKSKSKQVLKRIKKFYEMFDFNYSIY